MPDDFMFSVRCHKDLSHKYLLSPFKESYEILARSLRICSELRAEILHIQTPPSFNPDGKLNDIRDLKSLGEPYLTFHGARMYKDAARLEVYEKSGNISRMLQRLSDLHC